MLHWISGSRNTCESLDESRFAITGSDVRSSSPASCDALTHANACCVFVRLASALLRGSRANIRVVPLVAFDMMKPVAWRAILPKSGPLAPGAISGRP
jgi:hypothetical protein